MGCAKSKSADEASGPYDVADFNHPHPVTPSALRAERDEFWDTRTEGPSQGWINLRAAAEAHLGGDFELRDAIIEGAGFKPVKGLLQVYDERGYLFEVPTFCVKDPKNLIAG